MECRGGGDPFYRLTLYRCQSIPLSLIRSCIFVWKILNQKLNRIQKLTKKKLIKNKSNVIYLDIFSENVLQIDYKVKIINRINLPGVIFAMTPFTVPRFCYEK